MKKIWTVSASLLFGLSLVACGDSSSSASSDDLSSSEISSSSVENAGSSASGKSSSSTGEADECTLTEDGVKVLEPVDGEVFSLGDSIDVRFVAKSNRAGKFNILYKKSPADESKTGLTENSIGEDAPDGSHCETVRVYLDPELIEASESAFVRVQAYNEGKIRANSGTFTVKE